MKAKILLINGSPNGNHGQSNTIANAIIHSYPHDFRLLTLATQNELKQWQEDFSWAEGFVFLSGTYWDSWGSPLQNFLEKTTHWEVTPLWLGKPAACIITMHSVGGKAILSRLQGVLNTMGVIIPPLCGLVYSLTTHLANQTENSHRDDFWQLGEIELLLKNVTKQIEINRQHRPQWHAWPVDRSEAARPWLDPNSID